MKKIKHSIGAAIALLILSTPALAITCDNNLIGNWSGGIVDSTGKTTLVKVVIYNVYPIDSNGNLGLVGWVNLGNNNAVNIDGYCLPDDPTSNGAYLDMETSVNSSIFSFGSDLSYKNKIIIREGLINDQSITLGQLTKQ